MYNTTQLSTQGSLPFSLHCQLLITTFLDEMWSDIIVESNKQTLKISREETIKTKEKYIIDGKLKYNTSKTISKCFEISLQNILLITKDPDTFIVRFDGKSTNSNSLGYIIFKFKSLEDYTSFIKYFDQFKQIDQIYRTREQDKKLQDKNS